MAGSFEEHLLKAVATVLFVEWGLVHIIAMLLIAPPGWRNDVEGVYAAVYDNYMACKGASEPFRAAGPYVGVAWPEYAGKVLCHHGLNLGWVGVWACAMPVFLYTNNRDAFLLGLVPYLADIGYFVTQDCFKLAGPLGQAQTFIVSLALFCTAFVVHLEYPHQPEWEYLASVFVPVGLFGAALLLKAYHAAGFGPDHAAGGPGAPASYGAVEATDSSK